jgi:hypothetical protein
MKTSTYFDLWNLHVIQRFILWEVTWKNESMLLESCSWFYKVDDKI